MFTSVDGLLRSTGRFAIAVPRGYEAEHPRAELLRYNGLWAHAANAVDPALITTPKLVDACLEHCRRLAPLHRWLVRVQQQLG